MRPISPVLAVLAVLAALPLTPREAHANAGFIEAAPTGLKNVVTVSASGGHFTTVAAALASITNASSGNRYLIKVGPGAYTGRVVMKPYVDLEGSGTQLTILTAPGGNNVDTGAVLTAASNSEIRFLWVRGGVGTISTGIFSQTGIRLTHVLVSAAGGAHGSFGVYGLGANIVIRDSEITVNGGLTVGTAVFSVGSFATIERSVLYASGALGAGFVKEGGGSNSTIEDSSVSGQVGIEGRPGAGIILDKTSATGSSAGVACNACFFLARNSTLSTYSNGTVPRHGIRLTGSGGFVTVQGGYVFGTEATISVQPGGAVRVAGAFLYGGAAGGGGFVKCSGVSDENYIFYPNNCP